MPFTPYHFGPGLLLKAAAPRRFSFLAFATTQVAIDLESLRYLTMGDVHVHRTMHTLPVATAAGLTVGGLTCALGFVVHAALGKRVAGMSIGTPLPILESELSGVGTLIGGVLGGVTHSIMDAIVHPDVQPLLPFSGSNPFFGAVGWGTMETACLVAGFLGIAGALLNRRVWRSSSRSSAPVRIQA
jgi:membrane-bound metal-dependent hydrolase YbcI (DUF457 family)